MDALLLAAAMTCSPLLSHKVPDILGQTEDLCEYAGKVVLVVNTASYCGYTPQYRGLQALHERYGKRGLVVLGFPLERLRAAGAGQQPGDRRLLRSHVRGQIQPLRQDVGATRRLPAL